MSKPTGQPEAAARGGRKSTPARGPVGRPTRRRPGKRGKRLEPSEDEFTSETRVFFVALRAGDSGTARRLLDARAVHVDGRDVEDVTSPTPLVVACEKQRHAIISALLAANPRPAEVNLADSRGRRPVWYAAKHGDQEMLRLLLETGNQQCDVNYLDNESGCSPLYRAVLSGCAEVCVSLIEAGADVNLAGTSGDGAVAECPLIKAVQLGVPGPLAALLDAPCDVEARSAEGLTALHWAVGYRRHAAAAALLTHDAPVNATSTRGLTAMAIAIRLHDAAMVRMLVAHGSDPDGAFKWGETPLEMAINNHSEGCAMALVAVGCRLPGEEVGPSCFLRAVDAGLLGLVKVLLAADASFLREQWLVQQCAPLALYRRPRYFRALCERARTVGPLRAACRSAIFRALGRLPVEKAGRLPLPRHLKDYVQLKMELPENLFAESSIYDDECPYDCSYSCSKPQCPHLDFSSSSDDEVDI